MADFETTPERSELMKQVRREGTEPEQAVRSLLTELGARYRLNVSSLPGSPDIANKSRGKAIFVHGCFWHHHSCNRGTIPDRNHEYWEEKFEKNQQRDDRKTETLREAGFDVLVVWECELEEPEEVLDRLSAFWFDCRDQDENSGD